jgi:hypothetical protein
VLWAFLIGFTGQSGILKVGFELENTKGGKTMCDVCLKMDSSVSYDIQFKGMTPFPICLCNECREVIKFYYLVICKSCGGFELWDKKTYAKMLEMQPSEQLQVLTSATCLRCDEKYRFSRG